MEIFALVILAVVILVFFAMRRDFVGGHVSVRVNDPPTSPRPPPPRGHDYEPPEHYQKRLLEWAATDAGDAWLEYADEKRTERSPWAPGFLDRAWTRAAKAEEKRRERLGFGPGRRPEGGYQPIKGAGRPGPPRNVATRKGDGAAQV